jgi:hypothetical protein
VLLISRGRILENLPTSFRHNYPFLTISMLLLCIQICFDMMILIMLGEEYKLWSFSLCNFLDPSITALARLTPNTFNVCSFLGTRHQVWHPYQTIGKHSLSKSTPKTMANSLTCGQKATGNCQLSVLSAPMGNINECIMREKSLILRQVLYQKQHYILFPWFLK